MSRIWLKIQGVPGPPAHGREWFEVRWINLEGLAKRMPVSMAVPLDAASQQFHSFAVNGKVFEKATILVQPQSEVYFYDCDVRDVRGHQLGEEDPSLSFDLYYERTETKYFG